jgi:hypothetical protein
MNHNNTILGDDIPKLRQGDGTQVSVSSESKTTRPLPPCRSSHGARLHPGNDWPNTTIVSVDAKDDQPIIVVCGPFDNKNNNNKNDNSNSADVSPCVSPKAAASIESTFVGGGVNRKPASRRESVRVLAAKLVRQMQQQQQQKQLSADETSSASNTSSASTLEDDEEEEQHQQQQEGAPPPLTKTKKTFILIGADDDEWDVLVFDRQLDISCN